MSDNKTLGIHCFADDKFYYLETGAIKIANQTGRVIKALTSRRLIGVEPGEVRQKPQYNTITIADAKVKNLEIVPIYLNPHVKAMVESGKADEKKPVGGWGRK